MISKNILEYLDNPLENIDKNLSLIEEEITSRIESLKMELDEMEKIFHLKIKKIRDELIKYK